MAPLRRKRTGAFMPEIHWRHYAENKLAPIRRKLTVLPRYNDRIDLCICEMTPNRRFPILDENWFFSPLLTFFALTFAWSWICWLLSAFIKAQSNSRPPRSKYPNPKISNQPGVSLTKIKQSALNRARSFAVWADLVVTTLWNKWGAWPAAHPSRPYP